MIESSSDLANAASVESFSSTKLDSNRHHQPYHRRSSSSHSPYYENDKTSSSSTETAIHSPNSYNRQRLTMMMMMTDVVPSSSTTIGPMMSMSRSAKLGVGGVLPHQNSTNSNSSSSYQRPSHFTKARRSSAVASDTGVTHNNSKSARKVIEGKFQKI